jgi:hypothetical protein
MLLICIFPAPDIGFFLFTVIIPVLLYYPVFQGPCMKSVETCKLRTASERGLTRRTRRISIDIKHSTLERVKNDMGGMYARNCKCEDMSDRARYNER